MSDVINDESVCIDVSGVELGIVGVVSVVHENESLGIISLLGRNVRWSVKGGNEGVVVNGVISVLVEINMNGMCLEK